MIGFPRSGTTLLDSILRTHSKTLVLEEKPYLLNVRHNYFKNNSEIYKGMKLIDDKLGGTTPLEIILKFPKP